MTRPRRRRATTRPLAQDGHRPLGDDRDPQRVREGAVEGRGRHHRNALGAMLELVEVEPEQALAERRRSAVAHLGRDRGCSAVDRDAPHGEDRGLARGGVGAERRRRISSPIRSERRRERAWPARGYRPPGREGRRRPRARARGRGRFRDPLPAATFAGFAVAVALPTVSGAGSSSSPRNSTSCSSSTPNCSCARRRASAISASASAVVASPAFSMKFACLGEIRAPPIAWPFSPHASSIRPGAELVLRVLEDAAERALVRRLRRLALRVQLRRPSP